MLPSYVWYQDMADFAETSSDKAVGRRLARASHGRGANVSAHELRAVLDRFSESERGRTIAHARTERSAAVTQPIRSVRVDYLSRGRRRL